MKAGLDEKGFRRKQYAEIEEDMFIRARNLFGEDINLSVRSPLGIFFALSHGVSVYFGNLQSRSTINHISEKRREFPSIIS